MTDAVTQKRETKELVLAILRERLRGFVAHAGMLDQVEALASSARGLASSARGLDLRQRELVDRTIAETSKDLRLGSGGWPEALARKRAELTADAERARREIARLEGLP